MDEKEHVYGFEKLFVWQESRELTNRVYKLSKEFPSKEKFELTNQIRRAAVSVTANIAEGSSRKSKKDFAHFLQISYSSLVEVLSHLFIAYDLKYLDEKVFITVKKDINRISNKINALYNSQLH